MNDASNETKTVFWHRELPPLDGEPMAEHVVEATSDRVQGAIERHGTSWHDCYGSLMRHTVERLTQEIARLGGHYAHVLDEHVESHRDDVADESWLKGRFNYMLYRRTGA
jgi:hypothetical protein